MKELAWQLSQDDNTCFDDVDSASSTSSPERCDMRDVTALFEALRQFDVRAVDAVLGRCDVRGLYWEPEKYRTLIHGLVLLYSARGRVDRPHDLHIKFKDILELLSFRGQNVNYGDIARQTPLHLAAAREGNEHIVKVLLSSGTAVNKTDRGRRSALHLAARVGCVITVKAILKAGGTSLLLDLTGKTPLHLASKRRDNGEVIELLSQNGIVNHQCLAPGRTAGPSPLHEAARAGQAANVAMLLKLGGDPNLTEGSGQTPLHMAATHDVKGSAVECLLEAGASSNVKDVVFEETPLHKAVNGQLHDNVRHLVNYGADTNASDHQGETPLHKAATTCRHLTIWFCLLAHGADPALTCKSGVTAMDLAMKTKNNVGVAAIRQYTSGNTKRIVKIPWQMYQESER